MLPLSVLFHTLPDLLTISTLSNFILDCWHLLFLALCTDHESSLYLLGNATWLHLAMMQGGCSRKRSVPFQNVFPNAFLGPNVSFVFEVYLKRLGSKLYLLFVCLDKPSNILFIYFYYSYFE